MEKDLLKGNISGFLDELHKQVKVTLSYHDTQGDEPEIAYHMLILGMVAHIGFEYHIRSNRESGYGRYDVALEPKNLKRPGYIFEFKKYEGETAEGLEKANQEALDQISGKEYAVDMRARGIKKIALVAMVFQGKKLHTSFDFLSPNRNYW